MAKSAARNRKQHPEDANGDQGGSKTAGNHNDRNPDRALERLVDRSPSRVSVEAAMRIRDVSRPR